MVVLERRAKTRNATIAFWLEGLFFISFKYLVFLEREMMETEGNGNCHIVGLTSEYV